MVHGASGSCQYPVVNLLAGLSRRFLAGHVGRRAFLGALARAGVGLGLFAGCRPKAGGGLARGDELADHSGSVDGSEANRFLRSLRATFGGTRIRILTEDTPPSVAARVLARGEFSALTGIEVEWEMLPLEEVFARTLVDTTEGSGHHDLFYLDQSWIARFGESVEPVAAWLERADLGYPGYAWEDILGPLVEHTATADGTVVGVPYDITLFIGMRRRDLCDRLGLEPPTTVPEWLEHCRRIDEAYRPRVFGTTAQWRVGHYALLCNMSAWLWAHGGSFFREDGRPALNDEAARAALDYMMKMARHMPPGVTTWDWHGEFQSFARGEAGLYTSWAEFFPHYDDPAVSAVVGKVEPFALPREIRLRSPSQCAFGETPGISHQGGSCLALSRASRHKEAAWIFQQWLTSSDVTVRASLLGGGASATRHSSFADPRILARSKTTGPGTTRHFPVMLDAIQRRMGTEPHHPAWTSLALQRLPEILGRMVTGQEGVESTCRQLESASLAMARQPADGT